ncbi:hypothetical protein AB0M36_18430 [Actinoplanes sp. NPDC051346]|uniref:phosphoketolase family protein n=1 Tax=Actinoplanes sp. NPDC051346 TaxID=3155048 RepID=UPI00341D6768
MTTADPSRLAEALWRAVTYLSVAQVHLQANPLLTLPLSAEHVKPRPAGHWGTVPGTAFALSHVAVAGATAELDVMPVIGAGHAGVVQSSLAWLTGALARVRPEFSTDVAGLTRLVRSFPQVSGLGAEVSPLLPGGAYLGGQLGGALAFALGAALDAPDRLVVPILGDGECETPTTAAAWLAARTIAGRSKVLPIIHVNGQRMGGPSLLGTMGDYELRAYARGLGWQPIITHAEQGQLEAHHDFHDRFLTAATSFDNGGRPVIFLRCAKGFTGPTTLAGTSIEGTWRSHKTPINDPHGASGQVTALADWLASYRPEQLFTSAAAPAGPLADAVHTIGKRDHPTAVTPVTNPQVPNHELSGGHKSFAQAVTTVLRAHAQAGDLRLFSPDELASNRLAHLAEEPWSIEVLAEEVLLQALAGWTATGRRGLLISYDAFGPLLGAGLIQLLKHRRLLQNTPLPSINVLLTSYGWHNTYTHGDPSLATTLLGTRDPAVRVLVPADPARLAVTLDEALGSTGRVNVIVAGKHGTASLPPAATSQEFEQGLAVWPAVSDANPDLVIVAAGDLPAQVACQAAPAIRRRHHIRVSVIGVNDLTTLGHPATWPRGMSDADLERYLPVGVPVLIATLGHPAAIWGLLEGRLHRPVQVIGWQEPPHPLTQHELAATAGMDTAGFTAAADRFAAAGLLRPISHQGAHLG